MRRFFVVATSCTCDSPLALEGSPHSHREAEASLMGSCRQKEHAEVTEYPIPTSNSKPTASWRVRMARCGSRRLTVTGSKDWSPSRE